MRRGRRQTCENVQHDRSVFRNEAVDATHLAEFHQVEDVVANYGLTLADLIGMVFASNISRWVPEPITEPALQVLCKLSSERWE